MWIENTIGDGEADTAAYASHVCGTLCAKMKEHGMRCMHAKYVPSLVVFKVRAV